MSDPAPTPQRHLGLFDATLVGVGAIVGGGVLALAGVAFSLSGPSAVLAFALNGLIAGLTALSFAEMAASFPESGGTYAYAKKVLSVEVAFMVGWVVWFASIVAAVLYALGFAAFAVTAAERAWPMLTGGPAPVWLAGRAAALTLTLGATAAYAVSLVRHPAGGDRWATLGKVLVFAVLILGGLWAFASRPLEVSSAGLKPFFAGGGVGLVQAMGYTFIALQGFDLIAAVGGEVRRPERNLPRAMLLSLGIALLVYLPLLGCVTTVGLLPGESISSLAAANPAALIALASERFLGSAGWWLVVVAGLLSMLSALQANLYGASRVAAAMARDRTLPHALGRMSGSGTPATAVLATAAGVAIIACIVPDLATAGAASSLIFLVSFALAHLTSILARRRGGGSGDFRLPWFPLIPFVGALACLGLAVFQGLSVLSAGLLAGLWLAAGVALYLAVLAPRARVVDASSEARDPELARLRGRRSLVLVPIANPASSRPLVNLASALTAPGSGRVLLLSVVRPPAEWTPGDPPRSLVDTQSILGESLTESFAAKLSPDALVTVADDPWEAIARVARSHRCASILLGLPRLEQGGLVDKLEQLIGSLDCDAVVVRAPTGYRLRDVRRILVPMGGRADQSEIRARILGHLGRSADREVTYLTVLPASVDESQERRARAELETLVRDESPVAAEVLVVRADDPQDEIARRAAESDLVVLGLQRKGRSRKRFGELSLRLARETSTPLLFVSRRG